MFALAMLPAPACAREVLIPAGTELVLVTREALSSKAQHAGDPVAMAVRDDVKVGTSVVIPAGTAATGQVSEARGTGGFGVGGKLAIAPLYLSVGGETVRLVGGRLAKGGTDAGAVMGIVFISGLFSGKSAQLPAGTALPARVLQDVTLRIAESAPAP